MPKRGATIYGEIVGFATNCDAAHITQPQRETMQICMEQSLAMAGLGATDIGYISAHGTATDRGDIAESRHCGHLWRQGPLSSLKSYFGHTLGACGALEAWMSVQMMREGWFAPTLNLRQPDEQCGALDYIMGKPVRLIASICKAITSRLAASIPQSLSNAGRNYVPVYTGKNLHSLRGPAGVNARRYGTSGCAKPFRLAGRTLLARTLSPSPLPDIVYGEQENPPLRKIIGSGLT